MDQNLVIDGKYTVESSLGGGSFSDVFIVNGPTGRSALKLLKKGASGETSPEAVSDFKHEFTILKDLNHPNIARILDFGHDRVLKQYYYTTELVEGSDVFQATEGRTVDEVLELFVQALRAFNYLHSYRVFHFDVKAANILITKASGQVKVIDFGLASIDPRGKMIGTPTYMAPEIIAKEKPDGRADLYSLGVLFYSCFVRQNPFRGKGVTETLRNQQTLIPPPASSLCKGLPHYLDRIFARLLEKNPANRYQRADEVLREINSYSSKKFAMETRETLLSYLPEEGRLIGRQQEIDLFERCTQRVFDPASRENLVLLMVFGEQGSGKSRLLKEFKYAAQMHGVSVSSCSVKEADEVPGWMEAFRSHLTSGPPAVFLLDDLDAWEEGNETYQQFRGAMARALFSDPEDRLPLLWVGSAASPGTIPASLRELLPKEAFEAIRLGPFDGKTLREYVVSLTGLEDLPEELLAGLAARTDGNPLLVTELLRSLIEEGALFDSTGRWKKTTFEDIGIDFSRARFSGVLEDLLFTRYERLDLPLREILEGLSVAGRLRLTEMEKIFEDLLTRDLIVRDESGGGYQIKNTTLAELVYQRLPKERRRALHDRAAGLYSESSPKRLFHEIRGSDLEKALDLCRMSAERQLKEARGREAVDLLRFAIGLLSELPPSVKAANEIDLHFKMGEALLISLDYPEALKALGHVETILSGLKDRLENAHMQVDTLLRIGAVYYKMGEIEKARGSLSAALALLRYLKGDRVRELVAENLRGAILLQEGKLEEARELYERTRTVWEKELTDGERKRVTNNDLGVVYLTSRQYPEALRQFKADLESYQSIGDQVMIARTHYNLGQTYWGLREFTTAIEHYRTVATVAQPLKNTELLLRAYNGLGNTFNLIGNAQEAVRYYERGLDLCERTGDLRSHAAILVNIGIIESAQGELDKSRRHLDPAIAFLRSIRNRLAIDRQILVRALIEEGDIALREKRWKPSEEALYEALRITEEDEGARPLRFWVLYSLGELYQGKGDTEEFSKILPEIRSSARSPDEIAKLTEMANKIEKPSIVEEAVSFSVSGKPIKAPSESGTDPKKVLPNFRSLLREIHKDVNAGADSSLIFRKVVQMAIDVAGLEESELKDPSAKEFNEAREKLAEMSVKIEQYESLIQASSRRDTKYDYSAIVARSKSMLEIFRLLDKITDTDLSVFIHGESGTGKELIARALHVNSSRAKNRFVAVNCGAIPANLIESELFGYKAGAFTGATRDKKGLFEEADGGTLLLDEVAELDTPLQSKLLRIVQEGEFYRLGDSRPIRTNVRILSASNKDIEKLVKEGKFREDLYYRLCQIRIDLPPLRERPEDIPLLVERFIRQEAGKSMKVSSRLLRACLEYEWPGNIRELENLVKVAVALSEGGVIDARAIPSNYGLARYLFARTGKAGSSLKSGEDPALPPTPLIDARNRYDPSKSWYDYEKIILAKAFRESGYNAKETASMLGIAPATVYKKIREIGLVDKDNPLFEESFHYEEGKKLKDYLRPIFEAALACAKNKPYTAIAQLKVSQGYFYRIMKGET